MKPAYLIDTVVFIDHLKGQASATKWLASLHDGEAAISVITRAEVLAGTNGEEKIPVSLLLDTFECLPIAAADADRAALLRQQHRWKLPDAFQAALAMKENLKLVTRNTKDFSPKKHAFVMIPYSL